MLTIGDVIYEQRTSKKLTFKELSKMSGVSSSYIFQIESGKKLPSPMILRKLADALGTSFMDLMHVAGHLQEGDIEKEST